MALYETVFIARQDITSSQVEGLASTFSTVITENGGNVVGTEHWGLKTLTYRIRKNRKGHYVMFNLDAPADAVSEMERQMRLNEDIIRYMTVKVEKHVEGQSIMMQNKGDRGGRGGRGRRDGDGGRDHGGRDHGRRDGDGGRDHGRRDGGDGHRDGGRRDHSDRRGD